ncbi:MAG: hypothetical protein JO005_10030 [Gammaproteobacteria bacterium]|nr:hypothetical protein [Gammaproteobacteria bacterium]
MSSLRLLLLAIGVLFVIGLAWWERRRPRQASERAALPAAREYHEAPAPRLREPLSLPEMRATEALPTREIPAFETEAGDAPLASAAATEDLGPEMLPAPEPAAAPEGDGIAAEAVASGAPQMPATESEEFAAVPQPPAAPPATAETPPPALRVEWPPDPERRVVALRLVATQPDRFAGRSLRQALAAEGFVLGRFDIFHKPDAEQRAVLSAAGLHRPGTFDPDTMDSQHFGGLSLFAVLPGPKPPPQAFDELVFTARSLNERLHGVLQDEQGGPLTPSRIATLRERLKAGATS